MADIVKLEQCIRKLRRCWIAARATGSIFELLLSEALEVNYYLFYMLSTQPLTQHSILNVHPRYVSLTLIMTSNRNPLYSPLPPPSLPLDRS